MMHWTELPKPVALDAIYMFHAEFHFSPKDMDEADWEETDYIEPDCEPDPEINWEKMTYEVYRVTLGSRTFLFWVAFLNMSSDSDAYYWREAQPRKEPYIHYGKHKE